MGTIMWLQKYKIFWGRAKSKRHFWQFFCKKKRGCYAPSGAKVRVKAKVISDKWHLKSLIINNLGVTLSLEIFLKTQLTNVKTCIFACSVKAGASLTLVKMVVPQNPCARIFSFEAPEQCEQWYALLRGSRVLGRATIGSQTAHVAHTNACSVHAHTVRTNLRLGSAVLHRTIEAHHIMVANALPPTRTVPAVNVGSGESLALAQWQCNAEWCI